MCLWVDFFLQENRFKKVDLSFNNEHLSCTFEFIEKENIHTEKMPNSLIYNFFLSIFHSDVMYVHFFLSENWSSKNIFSSLYCLLINIILWFMKKEIVYKISRIVSEIIKNMQKKFSLSKKELWIANIESTHKISVIKGRFYLRIKIM